MTEVTTAVARRPGANHGRNIGIRTEPMNLSLTAEEDHAMPIKIVLSISKKIGMPDYGSVGASFGLEQELDSQLMESDLLRDRIRAAYVLAEAALEEELDRLKAPAPGARDGAGGREAAEGFRAPAAGGTAHAGSGGNPRAWDSPARPGRPATAGQVKAIYAIARQAGTDLEGLFRDHGVTRPEQLSLAAASKIIDDLKAAVDA